MSGYSQYEQAVGSVLNRFPRAKKLVEAAYQRTLYMMAGQRGFEYDLHEAVTIDSLASFYSFEHEPESMFIGFYDVVPWNDPMDAAFAHEAGPHDSTTYEHADSETSIVGYSSDGIDPVASTRAWNYQQGSRTQWHPTRSDVLLFNDIDDSSLVARWISVTDDDSWTFPYPIQAVSPTGKEYISLDYRRLDRNSPGYGYGTDDGSPLSSPSTDGLRRVPLDAQKDDELIVSFAELRDSFGGAVSHDKHYIHHAVFSPDGKRLAFLHRWMDDNIRKTRLIISTRTGEWEEHLRHSQLSHFCWLDSTRLFLTHGTQEYGRGYHILDVETGAVEYVDALDGFGDGYPFVV
jgi:hypothetical protein